jgi:hypothetical protein
MKREFHARFVATLQVSPELVTKEHFLKERRQTIRLQHHLYPHISPID